MHAAALDHQAIFETLFEKGADLEVRDFNGDTFIELAKGDRKRCVWLEEFLRGKGLGLDLPTDEIIERLNLHREQTGGRTDFSQDQMLGDRPRQS